jgi:glyoxylase-like metal-dependent hydrolase (beta-lactamase superfamily II)
MRAAVVARAALKVAGFAVFAVVYLLLLLLTGVGFYMEDANSVLLSAYIVFSLCLLVGLAWPRAFHRFFVKAGATRRRVATIFGVPAGALLALLYFLTTFHVRDLDEIVLLLFAAASFALIVGLARPSVFGRYLGGVVTSARAVMVLGTVAITLLLLFLVTLPVLETRRLARLERADADRREAASSVTSAQAPSNDGQVKFYPLHVGDTRVTYGQFYGGLSGWEGLAGYVRTLVDKDLITVPIYAYLIDHPDHGPMLVDTGVGWDQAHDHDGYYGGILARLLTDRDEYILPVEQELEVQVERLGYELGDIETVFMTHVHDDHAGGLRSVPNAKVFLGKADWERGVLYGPSFETAEDDLEMVTYTSGPFRNFDANQDVFGDGSVRLLPTPGHSPGHTSVLLRMDGYHVLFVGDHAYTLRHLAVEEVRQMTIGGTATERQVEGIRRVRKLLEELPNTVMLHAHDHSDYQSDLIEPFLADGDLSTEERREIGAYESGVFTGGWRLRPSNEPSFVPPGGEGRTGEVEFR